MGDFENSLIAFGKRCQASEIIWCLDHVIVNMLKCYGGYKGSRLLIALLS